MSATRKTKPANGQEADALGLLANGSSGSWDFAIDRTMTGADRWFAQLEGPSLVLSFEISSPRLVGELIEFLEDPSKTGGLPVGRDRQIPVTLIKDDEFPDRFFWVVGPESAPVVRLSIAGEEVRHLTEALRQTREDLES